MAFASTANAGITIPAGDWTVDIGGNVNAFYTNTQSDKTINGTTTSAADQNTIGTGLLPSALGIGAKTRQNDLDVALQFTFFTGSSSGNAAAGGNNTLNIRQAFMTFGDASWGTIKLGRDLGIYGSDAILSDMTLLGVGVGGPAGGSSTLGRIGSGYIYADWKGQISYASPNWNGFSFAAGVMEGFNNGREDMSYEGKVAYDFAANDVTGRVWVSGLTQKTKIGAVAAVANTSTAVGGSLGSAAVAAKDYTSKGWDIGGKVSYQGAQLVGYFYEGDGLDSQTPTTTGAASITTSGLFNGAGQKTQDSGGYVQATFAVPGIGTKLGASWGVTNSKAANGTDFDLENESWIVGAYHPLTKSVNLVAEYTNQEIKNNRASTTQASKIENDTVSLGAIMFF